MPGPRGLRERLLPDWNRLRGTLSGASKPRGAKIAIPVDYDGHEAYVNGGIR